VSVANEEDNVGLVFDEPPTDSHSGRPTASRRFHEPSCLAGADSPVPELDPNVARNSPDGEDLVEEPAHLRPGAGVGLRLAEDPGRFIAPAPGFVARVLGE
jgi:hypothetical protein